jgi:hypothetical protein
MSLSTESAPDAAAAVQAPALAPGLASAAFGIRDTRGVVPLSLPPEGEWESLSAVVDAAQEYAKLAGYAVNQGLGGEKRHTKGGRWTEYLVCVHSKDYEERRGLQLAFKKRPNRTSKKSNCLMQMKIQERPNGMWSLTRMDGSQKKVLVDHCTYNHPLMDPKSYYQHRALSDKQLATVKLGERQGYL